VERQAARRHVGASALVEKAALDQRVGHQTAQIVCGPALHAGRDFFREQFEQKV
jgi:hypothetical protein